jgi:hypothetical protein
MAYKLLSAAQGCNTSRMFRVVDGTQLVAMFLSSGDAEAYIESKEKARNAKPLTGNGFDKFGQRPFR